MAFSRQEHCNGLPFPFTGDLPDPGIKPASSTLAGEFFTTEPPGKPPGIKKLQLIKTLQMNLINIYRVKKSDTKDVYCKKQLLQIPKQTKSIYSVRCHVIDYTHGRERGMFNIKDHGECWQYFQYSVLNAHYIKSFHQDFSSGSGPKILESQCRQPSFDPCLGNQIPHVSTKDLE